MSLRLILTEREILKDQVRFWVGAWFKIGFDLKRLV
ncbi:hypothetical protein L8106_07074 [Lyngbya sp. PCC 8106]|nr:hypothetical protein L8106_07074 [Lyngbya sp. PCC 8106]